MPAPLTNLIPLQELPPGAVNSIRRGAVNFALKEAATRLGMSIDELVVRDVRPVEDLQMYSTGTTLATIEDWVFTTAATTTTGFVTVTGDKNMGNNRFVVLFGVRDNRLAIATVATAAPAALVVGPSSVSLVKVSVGGADKVVWDTKCMQGYGQDQAAFTQYFVLIPQNTTFNISYYKSQATASMLIWLALIGITVEPRGKIISP